MQWLDELTKGADAHLPAIIDFDGSHFTYGQLEDMVATLAEILRIHGVRPGDRVMLVSENCATFAVAILAVTRLRAWITPANARQSVEEVEAIRTHSGARMALFTPEASENSAVHARRMAASKIGRLACGVILASQTYEVSAEPVTTDPKTQVAALMYTTGTTSAPKGVMLTHNNLMWNARVSGQTRKLGPNDTVLAVLPATHIYCFSSGICAALYAGATIRFMPRFSPQAVLDAFAEGITMMPAVPQMYQAIVNHLKSLGKKPSAPKLRLISSGGAPLDPAWKKGIEEFFGLPLHNGYGLTETSPGVTVTRPERPRDDVSVGELVEGVEVLIDQPDQSGVGEVLIRGPNIMLGYYRNPVATAEAVDQDGWFHSGDLGHLGVDGELYIVGRRKELIIRSGFNVYPPEVEAMLTRHPKILQAAVIGRTVSGDEQILAFLLVNSPLAGDEVKFWLRDHLVAYKIPQHVFVVDSFPTAPTGKILKHKLATVYAGLLEAIDQQ
ncbi:MAG: class I adenylate-forming enzyme family protein [Rhodobacterales bacterium]